ncbi:hypothetical protein V3C10_02350 [[Clostridium] symbiosum]|uniref:hypothetical protein n=1 Tax=Clostridium symbiosum TaxID=1512 RepID=UPI001D07597A|nr:hypothetical protein [[Clostridium] symbiosum]MCB6608541.1 hypothetical protein [[Clostridium] symbiosum]MCB6932147.1 hypothetical protein [[Clostridium] symbiosum]
MMENPGDGEPRKIENRGRRRAGEIGAKRLRRRKSINLADRQIPSSYKSGDGMDTETIKIGNSKIL